MNVGMQYQLEYLPSTMLGIQSGTAESYGTDLLSCQITKSKNTVNHFEFILPLDCRTEVGTCLTSANEGPSLIIQNVPNFLGKNVRWFLLMVFM
jgi:hypothetical protein